MLTIHQQIAARPERAELMGLEGWKVPTTALREQVLSNNVGEMFVDRKTIAASADRWNMMPITLGHPTERGQPKSGRSEDVLNERAVGFLLNAEEVDGELKADAFFPDNMLNRHGVEEDVIGTVKGGQPVPVSTGFGGHFAEEEGTHDGTSFNVRARTVEPDHFAVLLDGEGACSTEDGCGLGVNHSGPCDTEDDMNDADAENVAETVANKIKSWFRDEVQPQEGAMNEEQIERLAEATGLSEEDLNEMDEGRLETMAENVLSEPDEETEEEEGQATNATPEDAPEWASNLIDKVESLSEDVDEVRESAEPALNEHEQRRNRIISEVAQNSEFSEDELEEWPIDRLKKLRSSTKAANWAARGGPKDKRTGDAGPGEVVQADHTPYWAENSDEEEG